MYDLQQRQMEKEEKDAKKRHRPSGRGKNARKAAKKLAREAKKEMFLSAARMAYEGQLEDLKNPPVKEAPADKK